MINAYQQDLDRLRQAPRIFAVFSVRIMARVTMKLELPMQQKKYVAHECLSRLKTQ